MRTHPLRTALTCASSDSGAGAGIQADLKTFAAHGVYGFSALAGVTAQNTREVLDAFYLPPELLRAQLQAVWSDFDLGGVKIGLLGTRDNAQVVLDFIERKLSPELPVVLDPVMCSASGHVFLDEEAFRAVLRLFPRALLVTPNLFEAEAVVGRKIEGFRGFPEAAAKIRDLGARNVLIKGGHLEGEPRDYLLLEDGSDFFFDGERIPTRDDHGTGCTLSSAILSRLVRGCDLQTSVKLAKLYTAEAMRRAPGLGRGRGPLHHFHQFYEFEKDRSEPSEGG
ncbi:MAG: bifunctional hydroxymethylpyrimidine kinase/phosphomethylpyrimidine kinase [Deltaproteobacteria bacterium]|jgi:hydroxymethylpyrimidine/phosphomethylpyrimidine kinase|nr:bifunctional hydroxymethylpyrimidine kinase/phosphomethylpyrimidine kinase [Deltaproteobacteria bacterium]